MKISSVDLSKITTYRFGGVCKNFIELESKEDLSKLSETVLGNENISISDDSIWKIYRILARIFCCKISMFHFQFHILVFINIAGLYLFLTYSIRPLHMKCYR